MAMGIWNFKLFDKYWFFSFHVNLVHDEVGPAEVGLGEAESQMVFVKELKIFVLQVSGNTS